ncbi:MBL fold metallo-hydrolase [Gordonia jinghuaiqii]|uniref:MBL fold metallo-hydrolase n=1 Tax=Gordonia jinghuaiqii TaxID=2758710 RepID=A0A7D7LRB4_9ACTN|nr:MBL fold metallo-hydrolase [Gordonia jinghuaiqii]QMT01483.1 MBL fold metallo-hydrolase [Gordonia jinghuaiqii]
MSSGTAAGTEAVPDWFVVRDYGCGVHLISEPCHVNSYLIVGAERALLFDTGLGIGNIHAQVRRITDLPLVVVNSHHHFDHRGGNQHVDAEDFLCHRSGESLYRAVPDDELRDYAVGAEQMLAVYNEFRALDKVKFFLSPDDLTMRPLPDLRSWAIPATPPTRGVDHGDVIDLGGRRLEVLHTPGHVPDSVCLWEADTGFLFCGDTVLTTTYWAHYPESDVTMFAASLKALAALPITKAFVGHNLVADVDAAYVARVAAAFSRVAAAPGCGEVVDGPHGATVRRTEGPGFAILSAL